MSIYNYIEISSSYRDRNQYPQPAQFEIPFNCPTQLNISEQVRGYYQSNKIINRIINTKDVITNGIIDYLWSDIYNSGLFHNDYLNGNVTNGVLTYNNSNPISYLVGSIIIIMDSNIFIGLSTITSAIYNYNNYITIFFNPFINLTQPIGHTYQYEIMVDGGTVLNGSTNSSVIVNGLTTIYKTIDNYYVGYQLNIYSVSSTILSSSIISSYHPFNNTFILSQSLSYIPNNTMYFTISNPSTNNTIVLPGIDSCGKNVIEYSNPYHQYYLVNETLSNNQSIVYSQIGNYLNRTLYLTIPFPPNWSVNNQYSIRQTLPNQFLQTVIFSGTITSSTIISNTTVLSISGLTSNYNYANGFTINITGYSSYLITSTNSDNTSMIISTPLVLSANVLFTIIPPVLNDISLSNCIFLPNTANPIDNYYTGQYIYIYPNYPVNNQITSLTNIQGSCFYISSYIGNGYNACFLTNVNVIKQLGITKFYPSYSNVDAILPPQGSLINIVSFSKENSNCITYGGSMVSQTELVSYQINLINLILPNQILSTGSTISRYPYVYVELSVLNHLSVNTIYSNNQHSNKALFLVPITDIKDIQTSTFIKLSCGSMTQTVKFRPNDIFRFCVFLPDGTLFQTIMTDYYTPSYPNPFIQINALFKINRL